MRKKGFTLIELLVVIAIISLLSSIVMASLNSARVKARDARRKTDLMELRNALEIYHNTNQSYPPTTPDWYSSEPGDNWPNGPGNNGVWIPDLAPLYISQLPRDPLGGVSTIPVVCAPGSQKRAYQYVSDGNNYKLLSHCAPEGTMSPSDSFQDPARPYAWMVCSGEPACSGW